MIDEEDHQPGTCWLCGKPVLWNEYDKRASEYGSFYDEDGNFECPSGRLHQG